MERRGLSIRFALGVRVSSNAAVAELTSDIRLEANEGNRINSNLTSVVLSAVMFDVRRNLSNYPTIPRIS